MSMVKFLRAVSIGLTLLIMIFAGVVLFSVYEIMKPAGYRNVILTQSELLEYFEVNRDKLRELQRMYREDTYPGMFYQSNSTDHGLVANRVREYEERLKEIRLFRLLGDSSRCEFTVVSSGYITESGFIQGVVVSKSEPDILQDTLPTEPYNGKIDKGETLYVKIEGEWYMYLYRGL